MASSSRKPMPCKRALPVAVLRWCIHLSSAGTRRASFGGLRALPIGANELPRSGVINTPKLQLLSPPQSHYRCQQAWVGARQQTILALYKLPQLVLLNLTQVGGVGDPHSTMLHGVHGFLVGYGFLVEACVLPDGVVIPAYRR